MLSSAVKSTAIIFIILINIFAQEKRVKLYPFKSAVIEYKYEASLSGSHIKYIDDYGYKQADYIKQKFNLSGNYAEEKNKIIILLGNKAYTIDFKDSTVAVGPNATYNYYLQYAAKNCVEVSEAILKAASSWKYIADENFLNKKCKKWKSGKNTLFTWQGLPVKSITNFMTMMVEKAVSIKTNIDISADKFAIPQGVKYVSTDVYQGFSGLKLDFKDKKNSLQIKNNSENEEKNNADRHITISFNSNSLQKPNVFAHYLSNGDTVIIKGENGYNKIDYNIIKSQLSFMRQNKTFLRPYDILIFITNTGDIGKLQINRQYKDDYSLRFVLFTDNGKIKEYSHNTQKPLSTNFIIFYDKTNDRLKIEPINGTKCIII